MIKWRQTKFREVENIVLKTTLSPLSVSKTEPWAWEILF